ncbi:unnamed protein product [Cuscuta epithymum]|uniref:Phytocyanin domain-containing protein n=1 Tax=Cuscuta epithymum TaxID=186058 RepID=A0AAV0D580_9ASTE|nr:unnamed protein product [Cuscuta epithymum]
MNSSSYSSGLIAAALFFLLFGCTQARTLVVGGKNNTWAVQSSSSLNTWAKKARFVVGDILVWKSEKEGDKVVQVEREDYERCNASKPISSQSGLNASVVLDHSGPFYFISGSEENCKKGLKLTVVVLSEKHAGKVASPAPAPAPALDDLPAVAPTTGAAALSVSVRAGSLVKGLFLIYLFFWCV